MPSPVRLNRAELEQLVGKNAKFIRAFEQMSQMTDVVFPDQVQFLLALVSVASTSAEDAAGSADDARKAAEAAHATFATLPTYTDHSDAIAALAVALAAIPEPEPDRFSVALPASEALAEGALVNVWNDAGTSRVRNADADASQYPAHGWTDAACTSGAMAIIRTAGINGRLSGLTPGAAYYLSDTTPGGITATAPVTPGNLRQPVGVAVSATQLAFSYQPSVVI